VADAAETDKASLVQGRQRPTLWSPSWECKRCCVYRYQPEIPRFNRPLCFIAVLIQLEQVPVMSFQQWIIIVSFVILIFTR